MFTMGVTNQAKKENEQFLFIITLINIILFQNIILITNGWKETEKSLIIN